MKFAFLFMHYQNKTFGNIFCVLFIFAYYVRVFFLALFFVPVVYIFLRQVEQKVTLTAHTFTSFVNLPIYLAWNSYHKIVKYRCVQRNYITRSHINNNLLISCDKNSRTVSNPGSFDSLFCSTPSSFIGQCGKSCGERVKKRKNSRHIHVFAE